MLWDFRSTQHCISKKQASPTMLLNWKYARAEYKGICCVLPETTEAFEMKLANFLSQIFPPPELCAVPYVIEKQGDRYMRHLPEPEIFSMQTPLILQF